MKRLPTSNLSSTHRHQILSDKVQDIWVEKRSSVSLGVNSAGALDILAMHLERSAKVIGI